MPYVASRSKPVPHPTTSVAAISSRSILSFDPEPNLDPPPYSPSRLPPLKTAEKGQDTGDLGEPESSSTTKVEALSAELLQARSGFKEAQKALADERKLRRELEDALRQSTITRRSLEDLVAGHRDRLFQLETHPI